MNIREAKDLAARVFHANGSNPAEGIVTEFADEIVKAVCSPCARNVCEVWIEGGIVARFQPVVSFRRAYAEATRQPDHYPHVGQDERAVSVGEIEGQFRGKVADVIREEIDCDREEASYLAAVCWESGTRLDVAEVREQLRGPDGKRATWVVGALLYLGTHDPAKTIEQTWTRARRIATVGGAENLSDQEWASLTQEARR